MLRTHSSPCNGRHWAVFHFKGASSRLSETSENFYKITWYNIPRNSYLHTRHRENLKYPPKGSKPLTVTLYTINVRINNSESEVSTGRSYLRVRIFLFGTVSTEVKRPKREAGHSFPPSALSNLYN